MSTAEEFHPRVATFTNLQPDHLDYYQGSYEAYVAAKRRLMGRLEGSDEAAVLNRADAILRTWSAPGGARTLWTALGRLDAGLEGAFVEAGRIFARIDGRERVLLTAAELPLPGRHNVENALAAATAGLAFGLSDEAVAAGLKGFRGLEHRLRLIRTVVDEARSVRWYDDSKATNPHASSAALRAFDRKIVLLAGGSEKGADFGPWADLAVERVAHAVCFGTTGPRIADAIDGRIPTTRVTTLAEAVAVATERVQGDGVVVLSPACASFDQFRSFEHRGKVFQELVAAL